MIIFVILSVHILNMAFKRIVVQLSETALHICPSRHLSGLRDAGLGYHAFLVHPISDHAKCANSLTLSIYLSALRADYTELRSVLAAPSLLSSA
jgi:hypothetical protein